MTVTSIAEAKKEYTVIQASLLIPGRGDPLKDGAVVISEDKKIHFVGPGSSIPEEYANCPRHNVPTLLPGLWDCHVHFAGATSFNLSQIPLIHPATAGARLARSAADTLNAGFTSVRDLGGWAPELSLAIEEGTIIGPHIYAAGAAISQTAGHGDLWDLPHGWVRQCCGITEPSHNQNTGVIPFCIADGVDECRRAVRLQLRRGAKVIKIFASGGVTSLGDNPLYQQFSDEELKTIVEEAGRAHRAVAAHVHGKEGIMAALRAGCKTLEHGTYLDDECFALMKEKDVILVPTSTVVHEAQKNADLLSPESRLKVVELGKVAAGMYRSAVKSGVKIALGTDLIVSIPGGGLSHGNNGAELGYAVEAGMTPLQAIEAATATAPETLGPQAPMSGQLKEGYDADLIALDGDPLEDITLVNKPDRITHVWKSGKLFKQPKA
ncbi:amidohydrolase [Trematosphaeria pertusa]|uniref:Amidohydrolase n=1 Tax=Trematosphaeria pertusa TaxID=390896 RepID=A0A6A6INC7_9PLEO|nr:amidohydrolase [Trematosphaeria pertusa]KAF2251598.1 amidohydrolase [Trematosphaeria pertusa]